MLARDGGRGGGQFVGLNPSGAAALVGAARNAGNGAVATGSRVADLFAQAGPDAAGATTPMQLRMLDYWLAAAADDVRWRMAMLRETGAPRSGGMLFATLHFASAAAARRAGLRYAADVQQALQDYLDAEGDDAEGEAMQRYLASLQAADVFANDPAWAGGLVDGLGRDGILNAQWFASYEMEGDVERTREIVAPIATALATAMRARTAGPEIREKLLELPPEELGLLLALAPAETSFLASAARTMLIDSEVTEDRSDDLTDRTYEFVVEALADNAEASYRFLTGSNARYMPPVGYLLRPLAMLGSQEGAAAAGRILEQGLVNHPSGKGAYTWDRATEATEETIGFIAEFPHFLRETDPRFNASLASLLRPHLDAAAVIGAESSDVDLLGYDVNVVAPGGRRPLDVPAEDLREFLGGVMQQEQGITAMQVLLATYSQSDRAQANRVPLLDGRVDELDPFIADSLRIAGLAGVVGQGLDIAGHDEEGRTRFLTGALKMATGAGAARIPTPHPAAWLAQQGAKYAAGKAVNEFSEWVATFEPEEGEASVEDFIEQYVEAARVSMAEHMERDPELSTLSADEKADMLRRATALAQGQVGEGLRNVYAELVGETEGDR